MRRSEVAGDVISGQNVKSVEGYVMVNVEIASTSNLRDNLQINFVTAAAEADIDDNFKRKRVRFSLRNEALESHF